MDTRRPMLLTSIILYEILSNSGVSSQTPLPFINYKRPTALSNNDYCACFENPATDTLDKFLDPHGKGLERLVIYVYRNSEDEITTYVPNVKKQLNFPDLAFEHGDIIDTDSYESIPTVFNTSPNVITVNPKADPAPTPLPGSQPTSWHNPKPYNNGKSIPLPKKPKHNKIPTLPIDYENMLFPGKPLDPIMTVVNHSIKDTNHTQRKTFEQWFDKEIKNVAESLKPDPDQLSTIEDLIQTALKKHGIKITSKGIPTDSTGKHLDISELHLRPVLIGDTLEYEKVKKKSKNTFNVPSDMPYSQALLITIRNPPKVLGVIQLRKSYIPSKDLKEPISHQPKKNIKERDEIADILKQLGYLTEGPVEPIMQLPANKVDVGEKPKLLDEGKSLESIPKALKRYAQHAQRTAHAVTATAEEPLNPTRRTTTTEKPTTTKKYCATCGHNSYYNDYEKSVSSKSEGGGVLNAFHTNSQSILRSLVGKVVDRLMSRRQELGGIVEDLAGPDFRIIGGAAATGSGSPISNRGRSGFIM